MSRLSNKLGGIARLVRHGEFASIGHRVRAALWSEWVSVRLERDLRDPFVAPDAKIQIDVRPLRNTDLPSLLDFDSSEVTSAGRADRERRSRLVAEQLPTAYVAVTEDDIPCYVQWLVGAELNDRIQELWNGEFPVLAPGEALLEAAFTPEAFRGRRIMPAAMARIAERAADLPARTVITFVTDDNVASLKGCARAGFQPKSARLIRRRFLRTSVSAVPIPTRVDAHLAP